MKKISRREFSINLAQLTGGLFFLPSLFNQAMAQATQATKKLIMIRMPLGISLANWAMNNGQIWDPNQVKANDPILGGSATQVGSDAYAMALSSMAYTNRLIEETNLKNFKPKMNIIRGLDFMSGQHSHNLASTATGSFLNFANVNQYDRPSFTYSLDYVLQKKVIDTSKFAVPVLRVVPLANQNPSDSDIFNFSFSYHPDEGTGGRTGHDGVYYKMTQSIGKISAIYQTLFSGAASSPSPTPAPGPSLAQRIRENILTKGSTLKNKNTLSAADKITLQNYLDQLSAIPISNGSTSNTGGTSNSCNNGTGLNISTDLGVEQNYQKTFDLIVQGLACQRTQVVDICFADLDDSVPGYLTWHKLSHREIPGDIFEYEKAFVNRVTYLINQLNSLLDVDGSPLLDNTLVVMVGELGDENNHVGIDVPVMTFGGKNLNVQQGYYLDYRKRNPSITTGGGPFFYPTAYQSSYTERRPFGRPYNDLLVSIFKSMAVDPSIYHASNLNNKYGSFGTFGNANLGFGEYNYIRGGNIAINTAPGGADHTNFLNVYRSNLASDEGLPYFLKT